MAEVDYLSLSDAELAQLLRDDVPCSDLTTDASGIGQRPARLEFRSRQDMVVCAIEEGARLFTLNGAQVEVHVRSGHRTDKDQLLLEARGTAQVLHRVWKTAQVLVEWASGISTSSAAIVKAAAPVAVACTRKNIPFTKMLSIKAVRAGGATMHRLGLSESLLLFAEHRLYLDTGPEATVARFKKAEPEKKLVVEVADIDEALIWAKAGVDVLQLEKFSPGQVAECRNVLGIAGLDTLLVAAGGVHTDNATAYVCAGADMLVTSAPYTAPPMDVQVNFYPR